ncbi:MAG: ArnT family glycosyltransferase [Anaerolineales bacterium]
MNHHSDRTSRWARWIEVGSLAALAFALLLATGLLIGHQYLAITHRYPLDYGEAPLVDQAMRLVNGERLYRRDLSAPPYTISNYPPLYGLTLAPGVALFGPNFWAGRLISALCAIAAGIFLALIIYDASRDPWAAMTTAGVLWAMPYVVHWAGLLRIDLLALALSAAALYVLVRAPETRAGLLGGAILLTAAAYTRQSYALAAPFAAFVWLWSRQGWRRAFTLAALVGGSSLALFVLLNALTGGGFFFNIVTANVNEYGIGRLLWNLRTLRYDLPLLLLMGALALLLSPVVDLPHRTLIVPYLIGAFLSMLTIGKVGSNVNYFLELCAALSLVAGAWIAWLRTTPRLRRWPLVRAALVLLVSVQIGWMMQRTRDEYLPRVLHRRAMEEELRLLEDEVAEAGGTVIGDEYMGLMTLQGERLYIQPFEVTQLAEAGIWDQTAFISDISDQQFAMILIHHFPGAEVHKERWTSEMLDAVERAYYLSDRVANTHVHRPRVETRAGEPRAPVDRCPGAPWRLPSDGALGVRWDGATLRIYGRGNVGTAPVVAVADGHLFRPAGAGWEGAVAILHDDPLHPGTRVWSIYGDLRSADGADLVAAAFPPGSAGIPVQRGDLLGYQGQWQEDAPAAAWMHVRFAVLPAGALTETLDPEEITPPPLASAQALSPAPYLGLQLSSSANLQILRCEDTEE